MSSIYHRISVRKYEDRPVEKEKITEILRAGMQAPSACNQQPWAFYVVENREMIAQLAAVTPYARCAKNAPVVIVTSYKEDCYVPLFAQIDLSICMENMWLRTDELGLGGVWLGIAPNEERMKDVEQIVGIPAGERAFGLFPLGYPAESRPQQDRFDESRIRYIE